MLKFIPTMNTGIVQTFGKYSRTMSPGLNLYLPFVQTVNLMSHKLFENQFDIKVRTADKVFPDLNISIQYRVRPEDSVKAYFQFSDPAKQMASYTDNIVRKVSSGLTLDELFESQSHIADAILQQVGPKMREGGYTIQSAQVRNISPPEAVLKSMNEINASERRKIAAQNDGQASKIKAVLQAEAQAKHKQLSGRGIALMRQNITKGWVDSIQQMSQKTGIHPRQALDFLIQILQQETMENMSKNAGTKVIFFDKTSPKKGITGEGLNKDQLLQAFEAHSHKIGDQVEMTK